MAHNQRFSEANQVIVHHADLNTATNTNVSSTGWIDMKGWRKCTCYVVRFIGAGYVTDGQMYCSAAATGSDPQAAGPAGAGSHSVSGDFSGLGGILSQRGAGLYVMECSSDEMAATSLGGTARYVSANIQMETATDEFVAVYILSDPMHKFADLGGTRNLVQEPSKPY